MLASTFFSKKRWSRPHSRGKCGGCGVVVSSEMLEDRGRTVRRGESEDESFVGVSPGPSFTYLYEY